jgi:hypothetical protein
VRERGKSWRDIAGFAVFVWVSIGLVNSAIDQIAKVSSEIHGAWPIIDPLLFDIGFTAVWSTCLTFLFIGPFLGWRRLTNSLVSSSSDLKWPKRFLVVFTLFEYVMVRLDEASGHKIEGSISRTVFQTFGIIIVVYACFRFYVFLHDRGYIRKGHITRP